MLNKALFVFLILPGLCQSLAAPGSIYALDKPAAADILKIPGPDRVQILRLADGSTLVGRIVEIGDGAVEFETRMGRLSVPVTAIKKVEEVPASAIRNGEYWFPNPNSTRLFFAPTARTLKRGEKYFSDYYLFFPALTVGVIDKISLGGGMSIFPGADLDQQLFYLTPKIGLKSINNLHFAAGALLLKAPDNPVVGIFYGLGTFGTPDASISAGLGYGYSGRHLAEKPMLMLGGEKRISRRGALVSENWGIPGLGPPLGSYGVRFFGEGLSFDLALINPLGEDAIFPGIPYIDLVYKF